MAELRYVVLRHEGVDHPHYDVMIETAPDAPLATWRSDAWPLENGTALTRLSDHRRAYLDYEGPLSANRGTVRRVGHGGASVIGNDTSRWHLRFDDSPPVVLEQVEGERWRVAAITT